MAYNPYASQSTSQVQTTKSTSSGSITDLTVQLTETPGDLKIHYSVSGHLAASINNALGTNTTTAHLVVTLSGLDNFKRAINSKVSSALSSTTGVPSQFWGKVGGGGSIGGSVPRSSIFEKSKPLDIATGVLPGTITSTSAIAGSQAKTTKLGQVSGKSTLTGDIETTFTPITIPVPSGTNLSDIIPQGALPTIEIKVKPKNLFYVVSQGNPKLTFKLSPDLFIKTENISNYNCTQLYKSVSGNIDSIKSNVNNLESNINSELTTAKNIRDKLTSVGSGKRLHQLSIQDVASLGTNELQNIKTQAQGLTDHSSDINRYESTISNIKTSVANVGLGRCNITFSQDLSSLDKKLKSLSNKTSTVKDIKSNVESLLTNVSSISCGQEYPNVQQEIHNITREFHNLNQSSASDIKKLVKNIDDTINSINTNSNISSTCASKFLSDLHTIRNEVQQKSTTSTSGALTCSDIPSKYRSPLRGTVDTVKNQYAKLKPIQRTPQKRDQLKQELQNEISAINNNVDSNNPCKSQLLSQGHNALSLLNSLPVQSKQQLPCSDRFSSVNKDIQNYRNTINNLSAPITPKEFQQVSTQGSNVVNRIRSDVPATSGCRTQLLQEVHSLTQRASRLTARVRTVTGGSSSRSQKQNQQIHQLLGQIQGLINSSPQTSG